MPLSRLLNAVLSPLNIAFTRRSTLDRLLADVQRLEAAVAAQPSAAPPPATTGSDELVAQIKAAQDELLHHQIALKWELADLLQSGPPSPEATRECPLCGHQLPQQGYRTLQSQCLFGGGRLIRYQCPACDVIFGPDKMFNLSASELQQEYHWAYKVYQEGDSSEHEIRAFHALQPAKDGVYLNYGAGAWSRSIELLRDQGWDVWGYEPHSSASGGGKQVISSVQELQQRQFDGIFSNNVLEHFRHPVDELVFMRDRLKPGGRLSHASPCFEYLFEFTRFHLYFYLGRSRQVLADKSGMVIKDFTVDDQFMDLVLERPGASRDL